jgi:hypothetical protein
VTARPSLAAFGLVLLAIAFGGCDGPDRSFEPVVFGLMEHSKPEGGQVSGFSRIRRDETGVHAAWEVETGMPWPAYSEWVRRRVPPDFTVVDGDGSSLTLRKSMEADVYTLQLEPIASTARVRATFEGRPH